jgi:hypothetical protein
VGKEGFKNLFGGETYLAGYRYGGEVFGIYFVGLELIGDGE